MSLIESVSTDIKAMIWVERNGGGRWMIVSGDQDGVQLTSPDGGESISLSPTDLTAALMAMKIRVARPKVYQ